MTEREITGPVDLCTPKGRVNRDAVGWTRQPVHRTVVPGWGRTKRWEYWGVMTPTVFVGLTVSSLDYAGVEAAYVLERPTGREHVHEAVVPLARGVVLPERCGTGRASASANDLRIELVEVAGGTHLTATAPGIEVDVVAALPEGHERMGVVVPWSDTRFQYTVKDIGRPVSGSVVVDGVRHEVGGPGSFGVLDHGRGRWPYSLTWNWGAGHGTVDGRGVGVQVGGLWTDGTGSTENALVVDGVVHKESGTLRWEYDRADWLRPWRIRTVDGDRVDLTFIPEHDRVARTNLLVVANETHQCFGTWSGWMSTDDGERVRVDGAEGWAEEARNRW